MSNEDKRKLHVKIENLSDILPEIIRAYLHRGNPSALLHRVLEGVIKYREETDSSDIAERAIYAELEHKLRMSFEQLRRLEDHL